MRNARCGRLLALCLGTSLLGAATAWVGQGGSGGDPMAALLPASRWPQLDPLPRAREVWKCDVIVVGGSLGGVAAASQAMRAGARTCLIELTPWLGGQVSSQGVSALDESLLMRQRQNFSPDWQEFKRLIAAQPVALPGWMNSTWRPTVAAVNSCWVGFLCFPPQAGAAAAERWLQQAARRSPESRWASLTAFKGAEFDRDRISAVYAVRRIPRALLPKGRLSQELPAWYSWSPTAEFDKVPLRLEAATPGRLMVIDATDTGELVAWAGIPHRVGSEGQDILGEVHAPARGNPECTQAFTFPFALAIRDDGGSSLRQLALLQTGLSKQEHRRHFGLEGFPMFAGRSLFQYRRIVSLSRNNPFYGVPGKGDITMVNWGRGNDWGLMDPTLLMSQAQIEASGQHRNWLGGLQTAALKEAENHALLFAEWLIQTQATPRYPLALLSGSESPLGTESGLSPYPYIREGRRILGRAAYGQAALMLREQDVRLGGGRDFRPTAVAVTNYAIDIHGCRYRDGRPSGEAASAPVSEYQVRPIYIPLEALIPQQIDNLLIGGKGLAVSHIVNAATRTHYGEWSIGAAAGSTAGWLVAQPGLIPASIVPSGKMPQLQRLMQAQGLQLKW